MRRFSSLSLFALSALSCGRAGQQHPAPSALPEAATATPIAPPTSAGGAKPSDQSSTVVAPVPKLITGIEFKRERELAVYSIGLADSPLIAVLSDEPEMRDKRGWRKLPIPAALRARPGETQTIEIYFGRDNRPRIMGTRQSDAGPVNVYLRFLDSGWRDGREEIGRLGNSARGGLYGVLGLDDPEVVCRAGEVCIIKRLSGWKTIPAGPEPRLVSVRDNTAWSVDSNGVSALAAEGWTLFAPNPPAKHVSAFWSDGKSAWLGARDQLFYFSEGRWSAQASPISEVSAFWGATADAVWVVGAKGAALYDGKSWSVVAGAPDKLRAINSRKGELWVGGNSGLFEVLRKAQ